MSALSQRLGMSEDEVMFRTIAKHDDEQLFEDWRKACEADAADPAANARFCLWLDVDSGRYFREREEKEQANARRVPRVAPDFTKLDLASVGRQVAAERARADLSQGELASAVDMRPSKLSKVELGNKRLTFTEACRIADALGISLERLRPR